VSSAALRDGVLAVPVVDISSFRMPYADADARSQVVRQVDQAARTVGFLQVTGHGIAPSARADLTGAMDAFFALAPHFEALDVGLRSADYPGLELPEEVYAADLGPAAEIPGFETAVTAWLLAAGAVARTMVRIFGVALGGREDYFAAADDSIGVLRMHNGRPPGPGTPLEPGRLGLGARAGHGIVTALWAHPVPGLEIRGADGRWHPVRPADGALLVGLGDAIARWANREWVSALHRVAPPRGNGTPAPIRSAAYFHCASSDRCGQTLL
jgi:isopenicillin N synthase-like dioxygenase